MNGELRKLRAAQAKAVMPMIGPLMDAYDAVPNDVRDMDEFADLFEWLDAINSAMEDAE